MLILPVLAQDTLEWVPYHGGLDLRDGIYFDFNSFRYNDPDIPIEKLQDGQGIPINDIREATIKVYWKPDTSDRQLIDPDDVWGYCQNDAVHIAIGNGFYRIGLMGSLCHLTYVQPYWVYAPGVASVRVNQVVHQLLDMVTGEVLPFNAGSMEKIFLNDRVLQEEFRSLRKKERNRDEVLFRFLRMYNDRHPLEFPDRSENR
ncbi:MAG: hypothetical protein M3R08_02100 [Bacteroidota bacterium]|nr:hypothetical protein [Bacteroidota bacterium]